MVVRKQKNYITVVLLLYFVTLSICTGCRKPPLWIHKNLADESASSHRDLEALETSSLSLSALARGHGIDVGAAVQVRALKSDGLYTLTLIREFSMITPENAMKFENIHSEIDTYCWEGLECLEEPDTIVDFAEENGIKVRGHTLVWDKQLPTWLINLEASLRSDGDWSFNDRLQFVELLREHIQEVVGHYQGRIAVWDVVNEPLAEDGSYKNSIWLRTIGPEYIEMAFRWAHEADPDALLFCNEYGIEDPGPKFEAVCSLVSELHEKSIPLHGIGIQMHQRENAHPEKRSEQLSFIRNLLANMVRLASLGLEVHITEMDVAIKDIEEEEHTKMMRQARIYRDVLQACLCAQNCKVFALWGFTDKYSWIPYFLGEEYGAGLIFDEDYHPKLPYYLLVDLLAEPYDTDGDGSTNCWEILEGRDPFGDDTDDDANDMHSQLYQGKYHACQLIKVRDGIARPCTGQSDNKNWGTILFGQFDQSLSSR